MKKLIIIIITACTLIGCSSSKHSAIEPVRDVTRDSLVSSQIRYDSIYIDNWYCIEHRADTIYKERTRVEYRYRLLHDTIRLTHRDSVPYPVTIVETREITRPLTWFDQLTRACFWFLVGVVVIYIFRLIRIRL